MFRTKRRRKDVSHDMVFFLLFGIVLSVLLAVFVVQNAAQERPGPVPAVVFGPDFAELLPSDAVYSDASVEEIVSVVSPFPSYAVAYDSGGFTEVALVAWDNARGRYVLKSSLRLYPESGPFVGAPSVSSVPLGHGLPSVVEISGVSAEILGVSLFVLADEGGLWSARLYGSDGAVVDAEFDAGQVVMVDIDASGAKELVVMSDELIEVYVWKREVFVYDEILSRAMNMSRELFPEPEP